LLRYRETLTYIICGVATVLFGIAVYFVLYRLIGDIQANTVAFVLSVLFAYTINAKFVFRNPYSWRSFGQFFGMRIGTIVISNGGLWLLLELNIRRIVAVTILNIVLIILNYLFSKFYIFTRKYKGGIRP
jgi:putative flippase GtrA